MDRTFVHPKTGKPAQMNTANIRRANQERSKAQPARKRSRQWGGIAADAQTVVRGPSRPIAQTALNIPHNPPSAARALVSAMGADFARSLIQELTDYLEGAQA